MPEDRRRDRAAGERGEDEHDDEDPAGDRDLVAAEADPNLLPVTACANLDRAEVAEVAVGLVGDRCREPSACRDEFRTFGCGHRARMVLDQRDGRVLL